MTIPKHFLDRINQLPCWNGEVSVSLLSGGMTNHNFKVSDQEADYVVRIGADMPEHLLWRENEGVTSEVAADCGFSPKVKYRESGLLVIEFVSGKVFSESDIRSLENLTRVVTLIKQFHQTMPRRYSGFPMLFWVFQTLRHYQNALQQADSSYCPRLSKMQRVSEQLEQDVGKVDLVFCHNDLLPANFIDSGDKIWLIDFDYAGFNSPLFDLSNLASNSELDVEAERSILEQYFDVEPDQQTWKSYNAMKCASLLREAMWSMVSESYSKVEFDYRTYTIENDRRFSEAFAVYEEEFH